MNCSMNLIGYWYDDYSNKKYPNPIDFINPDFWEMVEKEERINKEMVCTYLKGGFICNMQRGFSTCRICGEVLGSFERNDREFIWPDGLDHYIKEHDVMLPRVFIMKIAKQFKTTTEILDSFWLDWSEKNATS